MPTRNQMYHSDVWPPYSCTQRLCPNNFRFRHFHRYCNFFKNEIERQHSKRSSKSRFSHQNSVTIGQIVKDSPGTPSAFFSLSVLDSDELVKFETVDIADNRRLTCREFLLEFLSFPLPDATVFLLTTTFASISVFYDFNIQIFDFFANLRRWVRQTERKLELANAWTAKWLI